MDAKKLVLGREATDKEAEAIKKAQAVLDTELAGEKQTLTIIGTRPDDR